MEMIPEKCWNVEETDEETLKYFFPLQPYFCAGKCFNQSSDLELSNAINNVDHHYGLVGILEQYEDTLELIERKIPSLQGIVELYKTIKETGKLNSTSNPNCLLCLIKLFFQMSKLESLTKVAKSRY